MIRDTSIEAYKELLSGEEISKKHKDILVALYEINSMSFPVTAVELFHGCFSGKNVAFSNIRARLSELRDMGSVVEAPKRKCSITGKRVLTWAVTDKLPKKITRITKKQQLVLIKDLLTVLYNKSNQDVKTDLKILWKMIREL